MLDYKDYIYAIYQYKSFSKAAKMLHVSQPWLSTAVKKTEMELQLNLFDRSTSPVSLTEAGRYYIEQIKKINAIEEDRVLPDRRSSRPQGHIRLLSQAGRDREQPQRHRFHHGQEELERLMRALGANSLKFIQISAYQIPALRV